MISLQLSPSTPDDALANKATPREGAASGSTGDSFPDQLAEAQKSADAGTEPAQDVPAPDAATVGDIAGEAATASTALALAQSPEARSAARATLELKSAAPARDGADLALEAPTVPHAGDALLDAAELAEAAGDGAATTLPDALPDALTVAPQGMAPPVAAAPIAPPVSHPDSTAEGATLDPLASKSPRATPGPVLLAGQAAPDLTPPTSGAEGAAPGSVKIETPLEAALTPASGAEQIKFASLVDNGMTVSISQAADAAPGATTTPASSAGAAIPTAPKLNMAVPTWPETLVSDISHQLSADGDMLTLTLTPERLGSLQIRLAIENGLTQVHIVAETPEAAAVLQDAQHKLAEAFGRAGLDLGSQTTAFEGAGADGSTGQSQDNVYDPAPIDEGDAPAQELAAEAAARPSQDRLSLRSVDLLA